MIATMIALFALSWVIYVVQARAWMEGFYVGCITLFAAALPYLNFDVVAFMGQFMPSLSDMPSWLLAICVPALKGFVIGDVENLILASDTADSATECSQCSSVIDASLGNFCPQCGATLVATK